MGRRADVIIVDDLLDLRNASTAYLREEISRWFWLELYPVLEPGGQIVVIGTKFAEGDLYDELREKWGEENVMVYRTPSEDGEPLWPAVYPLDLLQEMKEEMGSILFNLDFRNDASGLGYLGWSEDWLQYFTEPPDNLIIYQGIDPSLGTKATSDFFVIVTVGYKADERKVYVLDIYRNRLPPSRQADLVRMKAEQWNPVAIGIESNAAQVYLSHFIQTQTSLPIRPFQPNLPKDFRYAKMSAWFEARRVYLPGRDGKPTQGAEGFVKEWCSYPRGEKDDILDAMSLALELAFGKPAPAGTTATVVEGLKPKAWRTIFPHEARSPIIPKRRLI